MKTKTRAVRIQIDLSLGFDRLFDSIPITNEQVHRLHMKIAQAMADENIGVVELLPNARTKLSLDMRYRTLPPVGDVAKEKDVPLSKLRKLGLPR